MIRLGLSVLLEFATWINHLKEENTEMKKGKKIFCGFILPFAIAQAVTAGCCAGWVYLWVNM